MSHPATSRNAKQREKKWRKLNVWSIKGPILLLALLLGFFDHALHWGRGPFAAGLAMVIPIIGFRDFWNSGRFWITIALLGVLQVPLVMGVRPLMEQLKFPFMLTFGILDCALMIAAVSLCMLRRKGRGQIVPLGGWLAHVYVFEAVTKLKIVRFESQDVVLRFGLDHNL